MDKMKKPLLVSVLAVVSILAGLLFVLVIQFLLMMKEYALERLALYEVSYESFMFSMIATAVLYLAVGIGMWKGTKWGWWLAQFFFVHDILSRLPISLSTITATYNISSNIYVNALGSLVDILLIWYFFRPEILTYFNMKKVKKIKSILIITGINIALIITSTIIFYLIYR